jgi:imidazolonepropionase
LKTDLVITGARQLLTLAGPDRPRRGGELSDLGLVEDGVVAAWRGKIVAAGTADEVMPLLETDSETVEIDTGGALVMPGFVDPHTHALFGRYRADEFALRVAGTPYVEIAAAGGGIFASVSDFKSRTDTELLSLTLPRLRRMIGNGSTTIEVKSGYGLDLEQELRALSLISSLGKELEIELVPTFLGAHEITQDQSANRDEHIREICEKWIPAVAAQGIARYVDVFCEPTVFTLRESRQIMEAAAAAGLQQKIHADEIRPGYGAAALAAELGATSADHLIVMSPADMPVLAASETIAILLPATSLGLASTSFAPARQMIDQGIIPALATDFNPGSSCCESMSFVVSLACSALGMSPAEALTAATHNAAWACGQGGNTGSLVPGKRADILIVDCLDYREIPYHMGWNPVTRVFVSGREICFPKEQMRDIGKKN